MENEKIIRLPSVRLIRLLLDGKEEGWVKFYYFYDRLFRKMLTSEFGKKGIILKHDEIDDLMQMLWMKLVPIIRGFKVQSETDFDVAYDDLSSFL